ncbi:MAG: Lrp/AsnC ligand binding domain-containing protein [Nitrosopumilaceae archaeon]
MPTAFILLNVKINYEMQVIEKLKELIESDESLKYEIHQVYGVYDMVVKMVAENMESLRNILAKIRRVDKISSTVTMLITEKQ